ncbi:AcrR family transcriptional regulator [Arthrobacter pigmenti]|uniref:AcrR family transcriptional regulator n=1 Tax=Arthrobacter pigmenti TaxID=271432 RepID=A0A846RLS2_9MICC|nr:TetR/AcrR family transcriptional regulator [Arthrobacter pigmenti]NJC24173.1 AcrR family transcriptional regulator [Arthrobacter pigmenti]
MTNKRADILAASTRSIAQFGVRGLRVNDVAAEAGVSPGLLYYHFKDRAGLLAATLQHINEQSVGSAGSAEADSYERLQNLLLDEIRDNPEVREASAAWNELRASAVFEASIAEPLRESTRQWISNVSRAIEDAQAAGRVDTRTDARQNAVVLTALVEGLSGRWLGGSLTTDEARDHLRQAVHSLLQNNDDGGRPRP